MQPYQHILQQKFKQEYQKLNPQQRLAVDTIEGPVMVIAGPGTGKTQILAARIGKVLLDTDALPENILCLTYTDAGAIAMRKRLQQFIGADAYKVNIYTFHAFCNDVIQDNLSLFEKNTLDAISELESIEIYKQIIDDFPKNHPLKRYRGDVYFEINNLKHLFSIMKREGWTPRFIDQKIDEYITGLPAREEYIAKRATKEFKKGDIRTDKIEEEKEKMEKLRYAINEFDHYQQLMRKKNRYDFDDMINWVINVFEENKNILANYQEKFQYILVDEYQDTSGTQNQLVQLLINYWDKPNIFVVGDDDQSIYRFQGANVENMLEFANSYKNDLITVVLATNYRSVQPILDVSKSLINKNEERLIKKIDGLSKELTAAQPGNATWPHIYEYNTVKDEMAGITNAVFQLLQQNISPGKIAIIYKENKYGLELAKYFQLKNIPVFSKRNINILENIFIKKIILLLRYINAEHDIPYGGDAMLFEIMHFDFYQIPPIEIAKLTVEANQKKYSGEPVSIRKLLVDKTNMPPQNLFDTGINDKAKKFSTAIETLIADAPNLNLQQFFAAVINTAGVVSYLMKSADKVKLLQMLTAFFDFIKEETHRNPLMELDDLIALIDLMQKEGLPLPMIQVTGTDKGVNLLTAHGSKGLEFEYVFIAGVNASSWEKKRKPGGGYKFPDTLFASQPKSTDDEELRRLFYVALTRAEKHLLISYAKFKNDGKEMEPSLFIAEIIEQHDLPIEKIVLPEEESMAYELLQLTEFAPQIEKTEEDFILPLLDKFSMNVTALNNYLRCPLEFYYKTLIRIPTGKSEATEFGSAIHFALEKLFRKMQESEKHNKSVKNHFPAKKELVADFNWFMHRHRENFTLSSFERKMEYGEEVLINYYEKYINTWNTVVSIERNIRGVLVNGIPLKGKIDKLEFNGNEVNVVDYKSGDIDKALPKMKPPHEKDPNGGDYWRQAVFYKILLDNYEHKNWKVMSTEFDFVEPDKKKAYRKEKIIISPQDIETVKQQISQVWEKIQNREFYTGCGKADCYWCNFVKNNQLSLALQPLEEGEIE